MSKTTITKKCNHKPKQLGYIAWHEFADKKRKRGAKQKQCPNCGKWYFKEEY